MVVVSMRHGAVAVWHGMIDGVVATAVGAWGGGAAKAMNGASRHGGGGGVGCGSHLDEAWPCFFVCRWFTILAMAPALRLVLCKSALTEDSPPRSKVLVSKFQSKS